MHASPDPSQLLTPEHITRVLERAPISHWQVAREAEVEPDGTCCVTVHCDPAPRGFHDVMFVGHRNLLTGEWGEISLFAVPSSVPREETDETRYWNYVESGGASHCGPWVDRLFQTLGAQIAKAKREESAGD